MNYAFKLFLVFFVISIVQNGFFCKSASKVRGQGIQIVRPVNHAFKLELNELNAILQSGHIKDRSLVVVSIAGPLRKGKSFLLNFFIKYLEAAYVKHDATDWLGETKVDSKVDGFKWRSGRFPETTGIWMWSQIFTHDYENGEKVAIILLDTQGIFDSSSNVKDYTTIFALSMMLSSVQCYNLMGNIQEDDLQNLQLFSQYGRLALQQTNQKPFQKLLFIIRDWPYPDEINYGWSGDEVIDELIGKKMQQTPEMQTLRSDIQSSFDEIGAFLMPHPGFAVAHGKNFTGHLRQIAPEFVNYAKELVVPLFQPENLPEMVRKINGQNVRARDFVPFLQSYIDIFNGKTLPEPKTIIAASIETSSLILYNDCLTIYNELMQKSLANVTSYFNESELNQLHDRAKEQAFVEIKEKPILGGDEQLLSLQFRIDSGIEKKFAAFKHQNKMKQTSFIENSILLHEKLNSDIQQLLQKTMIAGISNVFYSITDVPELFAKAKEVAWQKFNAEKVNDVEIATSFGVKLEQYLNETQIMLDALLAAYDQSVEMYRDAMQEAFDQSDDAYFKEADLKQHHLKAKNESVSQFQKASILGSDGVAFSILQRIQADIDYQLTGFEKENQSKRRNFVKKANAHNEQIGHDIKTEFEKRMISEIEDTNFGLKYSELNSLYDTLKEAALTKFTAEKMGDDEVSFVVREKLLEHLDGYRSSLIKLAESYNGCITKYRDSMERALNEVQSYSNQTDLNAVHRKSKKEALAQLRKNVRLEISDLGPIFQNKADSEIEDMLPIFEQENQKKQTHFMEMANLSNERLMLELKEQAKEQVINEMSAAGAQLSDIDLFSLFSRTKQTALDEFDEKKIGDDEMSRKLRKSLDRDLESLLPKLKQLNGPKESSSDITKWLPFAEKILNLVMSLAASA